MEIRRRPSYEEPFKQIETGEVFLSNSYYYMRIEKENLKSNNAVCLTTGSTTYFDDNEIVAPIDNCYLAIE